MVHCSGRYATQASPLQHGCGLTAATLLLQRVVLRAFAAQYASSRVTSRMRCTEVGCQSQHLHVACIMRLASGKPNGNNRILQAASRPSLPQPDLDREFDDQLRSNRQFLMSLMGGIADSDINHRLYARKPSKSRKRVKAAACPENTSEFLEAFLILLECQLAWQRMSKNNRGSSTCTGYFGADFQSCTQSAVR